MCWDFKLKDSKKTGDIMVGDVPVKKDVTPKGKTDFIEEAKVQASKKGITLEEYLDDIAKLLSKLQKYKPIKNKFPHEALPKDGYILDYIIDAKGLFRQLNGNIVTSRDLNFVITKTGKLKIGIKHHLLGNAEDVLMAGGIRFKNGKIVELNNLSGHYKPSIEEASILENLLKDIGIPVKKAKYEISTMSSNSKGYVTGTKKAKTIFIDNINS